MNTIKPRKILRVRAVMDRTGLGHTSLYKLMSEGKFPRPIKIEGIQAVGWDSERVDAWIAKQLDSTDEKISA